MSGFDVLCKLRVSKVKSPILILSGLAGIEDKVRGLGFGADDYITKPFHKDELVARIHAIVRRSKGHAQSVIHTDDLCVNLDSKTVEVNGARVPVTGKEYQMLELLALRKGTTLTKEMFLSHLYGGMDEPEMKIVDVFICKLRKKLASASGGKDYIETIWERGYVMREPSENAASGTVAGQTRQAEVTGLDTGRCPLWVISGHGRGEKRTWRCAQRTDELCHRRDDVGTRSGRRSGGASLCPPAKILFSRGARDFIRFGRDAEPPQQASQLVNDRRLHCPRTVCGVCPTPLTGRRKSCTR